MQLLYHFLEAFSNHSLVTHVDCKKKNRHLKSFSRTVILLVCVYICPTLYSNTVSAVISLCLKKWSDELITSDPPLPHFPIGV